MHICLFDIDGTLLDSGGAGKAAIETALVEDFGVEIRTQVSYSGRTDRAIGRDLLTSHEVEATDENWQRLVRGYLARLPAALSKHRGTVLPGVARLLTLLRGRQDVAVGLLTGNIREGARVKLGHFDLFQHFAFGGYGDIHFDRDDVARDALQEIHARYNGTIQPQQIVVIGDTPLDVRCARAIGARVAAVATGWHTMDQLSASKPDLLMEDLSDAEEILRMMV
jgi:phosphoglycolate phosphatase-like HAD superfamily hydrolase